MSTKYELPSTLIKHRGFFDYSAFLQTVRKWYADDDYDFNASSYKQKYPGPTGTEHEFRFIGDKRVTEYVKFHMIVIARVYSLRDVEIVQDGKKVKLQDGQLQVEVIPEIEFDWQNRFKGAGVFKSFIAGLDDFYRNYIIKYKISDYWEDMVLIKSGQLANAIRHVLGQEVL